MNLKKKLEALGDHFKVPRGNLDLMKWSDAIKKAAKSTDSADVLYDRFISKKSPPAVIEGKAVEVKDDKKPATTEDKTLTPGGSAVTTSHAVDVKSPTFIVNIPAPTVNTSYGTTASWAYTMRLLGQHAFTFLSGTMAGAGLMLGVLVAKSVLKIGAV